MVSFMFFTTNFFSVSWVLIFNVNSFEMGILNGCLLINLTFHRVFTQSFGRTSVSFSPIFSLILLLEMCIQILGVIQNVGS